MTSCVAAGRPRPRELDLAQRIEVAVVAGLAIALVGSCRWGAPSGESQPGAAAVDRSAYVTHAAHDLDGGAREAALLAFAARNDIRLLALYGLGPLLVEPAGRAAVARFIRRAGGRGIAVAAPVAGPSRVRELARYLDQHPAAGFSVYVTEVEYWRGAARERAARFAGLLSLVDSMRVLATRTDGRVAVYLGYPYAHEVAKLAPRVDEVWLNAPVASPAAAWSRRGRAALGPRVSAFAKARVAVRVILYARGEVHLASWLRGRRLGDAERELARARPASIPEPTGVVWFAYPTVAAYAGR